MKIKGKKVTLKSFDEIKKIVDNNWSTGEVRFTPKLVELCGKSLIIASEQITGSGCVFARLNKRMESIRLPLSWLEGTGLKACDYGIIPEDKLVNGYRVALNPNSINVGCRNISKTQELAWFRLLAERNGYELQG